MFNLINRYIFREALGSWFLVTAVLLFILLSNQFAEVLADAAANRLPRDAVFLVLGLSSLQYLTILGPLGLFLGLMLALARLNSDSEMAALMACGIGPGRLMGPLLLLASIMFIGLSWIALEEGPAAVRSVAGLELRAKQELELGFLQAGRFTTPDGGDTVIYAREVGDDGRIGDVFIQRREGDLVSVVLAAVGERQRDEQDGYQTFVLYDGQRYEGVPGQRDFRTVEFAEHGIPLVLQSADVPEPELEAIPSLTLLRSDSLELRAELHWRASAPISLFILALLAIPLSRSQPREGRFGRVAVGILVYIVYSNLLAVARVWLERGIVPEWAGLWWVHGLVLATAVWLLARQVRGSVQPLEAVAAP
ncbi:MAG: LPS export ABC transporter permease LptF [Gammaproteobacteria bacterium]